MESQINGYQAMAANKTIEFNPREGYRETSAG